MSIVGRLVVLQSMILDLVYSLEMLRVPRGSLSRFRLSLPQCNVRGVFNCMSGRLKAGFLACIDDICVFAMKL